MLLKEVKYSATVVTNKKVPANSEKNSVEKIVSLLPNTNLVSQ